MCIRDSHTAPPHDGDGLEAPVRVRRKAGHGLAVVHAPAVGAGKVLAQLPAGQRCIRAEPAIAARVGIVVVDAEQEGVDGGPRKAQRQDAKDGIGGHACGSLWLEAGGGWQCRRLPRSGPFDTSDPFDPFHPSIFATMKVHAEDFGWAVIGPGRIAHRFAEAVNSLPGARLHGVYGLSLIHI